MARTRRQRRKSASSGGAFGLVGNALLPKPVCGIWAINGNIGEWHVLTEDGFYLTRLFQGDPFKTQWPDQAVPGAILGAFVVGMLETFWSAYFTWAYKDVSVFALLAVILIFRPHGLLGRPQGRGD